MTLKWDTIDDRAVTTAKILAADAVEQAGSGHPGTAISIAPAAYLLYQRHMHIDPKDDRWLGRDRFVLSAGHSSLTQYVQLYLAGIGLELNDLKTLRTAGSLTPGHPEYGHTKGVEITTGPLGTGIASAVGFAMASRRMHGLLDPEAALGESVFDTNVYALAGDGCFEEGVSAEASSLAGTQKLGNLTLIWDDNHISIEDDTKIAFSEDVLARYEAYGWHVQRVNWLQEDGSYTEDVAALSEALDAAKAVTDKPSIIAVRTLIGWPTPGKTNTGGIHGSKLGGEALSGLKEALGADPEKMFDVDVEAVEAARANVAKRCAEYRKDWDARFEAWKVANPQRAELLERLQSGKLPEGWEEALPTFEAGKAIATRAASGTVLNAIAEAVPELWGGSADLAGSNNTYMKGQPSFLPEGASSDAFQGNEFGRNMHFGVREFAMGAIMNGIAADGLTRPYGGTFFVFSDFMRGAVRLAALMDLPVTYVWTHDSIGVGEDGPTHQPIEHLASYRAIPNLAVIRPGDATETAAAWRAVLEQRHPAALVLSRQNLPNPARGEGTELATADGLVRGAYVLADTEGTPDVIIMASGSEVSVALEAREALAGEGVKARVVSVPCLDWFEQQDAEYREEVLPSAVKARVSVEAGIALPWYRYLGDAGRAVSIEHFGASAPGDFLFKEYGIDADHVVAAAKESIAAAQ
ncbi:transketolase [Actinomycetaceae bacterium UMB8039B]|uniref:transketolase n=1 Tax=unclassified Pauljensenia TaxID=2908895 RepID=UPI002550B5F2|nr:MULTISPECIES: transketolase [unclassified Pauljensenia]MDK7780097.1 transketolase [Actinomycetaceae bacterium UMB8041B]MDK8293876.1 transketolase [Actinomycetaceae bacterium UMB8039B]MDK8608105.1 transketolase [Actinomycetaceae bacterium UMB8041A]MDK8753286.1 transketolase [Actinomycetaceae bacterium UMB8039A]MDK6830237.1 transketolase [Pauljensenia sp. UMB8040A]